MDSALYNASFDLYKKKSSAKTKQNSLSTQDVTPHLQSDQPAAKQIGDIRTGNSNRIKVTSFPIKVWCYVTGWKVLFL